MADDPVNSGKIRADFLTRFKPGNPGKPKGCRHKLGEAFISALHEDFQEHGVRVIETVRSEKPDQYLKVVASLLPKQFELPESGLAKFTDEQLDQLVAAVNAWLSANAGAGSEAEDGREQAASLQTIQ